MTKRTGFLLLFSALLMLLQGCAPSVYAVAVPESSNYLYIPADSQERSSLNFVDSRADSYTSFTSGRLPMGLTHNGTTLDPISFVEKYTISELAARGIPVEASGAGTTEIQINKIIMRNYRTTGFSPFTTVTMLSADVVTPASETRVGSFMVRGKVPVWSFDEVIEPTMNQPLQLLVQDLAAKINNILYQRSIPDSDVQELIAQINADPDGALSYIKVYELGFSNNASAIDALVDMTKSPHEYIRLAAISSLGTIAAESQVDYLIKFFKGDASWQDKAMAVKSLGDIASMGNDQASAFLRDEVENLVAGESAAGADWTREILGLYLRD
jgi:hypothetical protein